MATTRTTDEGDGMDDTHEDALPPTVQSLIRGLDTARHAFDGLGDVDEAHHGRILEDLVSTVPDLASAAARAGHGAWASMIVLAAADCPPEWATGCPRWKALVESSFAAIDAANRAAADEQARLVEVRRRRLA